MQTNPITCNTERDFFPAKESTSENEKYANDIETYVTRFVRKLGIRPNLIGYRLLIDAMILTVKEPKLFSSLTKEIYPGVAKKYGKDVRFVERNIRRAINSAYEYNPERIESIFYYAVDKPYISEVISLGVEEIRFSSGKVDWLI
jgi:two-component system response regulator (stage 0 sporulation protein A)